MEELKHVKLSDLQNKRKAKRTIMVFGSDTVIVFIQLYRRKRSCGICIWWCLVGLLLVVVDL